MQQRLYAAPRRSHAQLAWLAVAHVPAGLTQNVTTDAVDCGKRVVTHLRVPDMRPTWRCAGIVGGDSLSEVLGVVLDPAEQRADPRVYCHCSPRK